jgi:hypothetical protein
MPLAPPMLVLLVVLVLLAPPILVLLMLVLLMPPMLVLLMLVTASLPSLCSTIVPVWPITCGVTVKVSPELQYEYDTFDTVSSLPSVVYLPVGSVKETMAPIPPFCSVLSEQLHWPFVSVHVAVFQPRAEKMFPALVHCTGTPEIARHELSSGNVTEPVVVVLSVYVPSSLRIRVPVV